MKNVVFGMLGTNLDRRGSGQARWNSWRPSVALCQHEDLLIDRFELLYSVRHKGLADQVARDIGTASPETEVCLRQLELADPWDFAGVYGAMREFTDAYDFEPDQERYLVHVTTGTHVVQICWFLLTEARNIPGLLLQTSPPSKRPAAGELPIGRYQEIDLDLSKYDQIAQRFHQEHLEGTAYLKQGIATRNVRFNAMIAQLEKVSIRSDEPILLMGPTGAGKSQLAQLVYALKRQRGQFAGRFVAVNCATLRGDALSSTLFGHVKGSFTGAATDRPGLLREADDGLLFLDEVGELGLEEQAMLLSALESKRFFPFGSDKEVGSNFQLVAGTNRELWTMVETGQFREDLLARLDLWTYRMPSLRERLEDIEPNLEFEIRQASERMGAMVRFSREARSRYLRFATSEATWRANFRDLNSSIKRMATLAEGGRISLDIVEEEIALLNRRWGRPHATSGLDQLLGPDGVKQIDLFDRAQLAEVVAVCQRSPSLAAAGRELFQASRLHKASTNDSHRLKQYLARFNLTFAGVRDTA